MDTIGFICERTHPVFWPVAERLAARGFDVTFFDPGERIRRAEIGDLAALVNKKVRPESFAALQYADRIGVPTWNGFFATTALSCRLVALNALEAVGCRVPAVHFEKPTGEYVAKGRYSWTGTPTLGGEGEFYQERVRAEPIDYKYYAVDDGRETHVRVLTARSKLTEKKELVGEGEVDITLAAQVRELLDQFEARALGVDFVRGEDDFYAVDVNPAPSFTGTGMERRIADSVASLTTIGA
jgi:glutathione synthase/RimK-type ligase-like ATP-grasp enzyme